MAEIDTSISDLWWLQPRPKGQDNTAAMLKLGMDMAQQKRDNAMQLANFNLKQKEADVQMHGQLLAQKSQEDFLADLPEIQKWMADPTQPPPSDLKNPTKSLPTINNYLNAWKSSQAGQSYVEAQTTAKAIRANALKDYHNKVAAVDSEYHGELLDSVDKTGTVPKYAWDLLKFAEGETTKRKQSEFAEHEKVLTDKATAIQGAMTERQLAVQREKSSAYLNAIDAKGMWGAYEKNLGGRAPNKDTFVRDTGKALREKDPKLSVEDSITHAVTIWDQNIDKAKPAAPAPAAPVSPDSDPLGLFK